MFRTTFDPAKKQWNGPRTETVYNPHTSLGNVILNALQLNASRIAQICADTNATTTFDELYNRTICAAQNLEKIGCQRGEVFIFFTNNTADIAAIVFAALCLGCPVTGFTTFTTKSENLHYLNITKPKYVFCDANDYESLNEYFKDLNYQPTFFTFNGQKHDERSVERLFEEAAPSFDVTSAHFCPPRIDGTKEIAFIVPSSGTTGKQKGVLLSHAAILNTVSRMTSIINSTDVVISLSGLHTITGVMSLTTATVNGSTRVVNFGRFSPQRFFDVVEQTRTTATISVSHPVKQLLNHPCIETANLSSFKHFMIGGEKVPLDLIKKMNKFLKNGRCVHCYGLTETVLLVALNLDQKMNDTVGQLISGCKAKVLSDHGDRVGIGESGDLYIKKTFLFSGYLLGGSEKAANNHFDDEGFFRTGDIAQFDENGDLFIVGRKKELFKVGGRPVVPSEIEEFLNKIGGVRQSCLVPIPDRDYDFVPAAVIVRTGDSTCTEQSIHDAIANYFSDAKRPKGGVYFVDSFPMTSSGKIARHLVAEMALGLFNCKIGK